MNRTNRFYQLYLAGARLPADLLYTAVKRECIVRPVRIKPGFLNRCDKFVIRRRAMNFAPGSVTVQGRDDTDQLARGKPVITLDFHPISGLLAAAGADYDIKLPSVSYQSSHGYAVNTFRFSRALEASLSYGSCCILTHSSIHLFPKL
ncbi:hypothetical protein Rs2_24055 [Raphanus sativus]|nr:hypothetical protein Rs2_24055 [Raphanus sativus]